MSSRSIASMGISLVGLMVCIAVIYTNSPVAPYLNVDITFSIDGANYLATWNNGTLAGNETIADTLFNNVMNETSNLKFLFTTGTYNITTAEGIRLYNCYNTTIWGEENAILKEVKSTPTNATTVLSLVSGENFYLRQLVIDQNIGGNVLAQNDTLGTQWIVGSSTNVDTITFSHVDFINGAQTGLDGGSDNVLIDHCTFYNIGEHPIYLSNLADHWTIRYSTFLNWAKVVRGFGLKIANSSNISVYHNIFDHDEDGLGAKNDVPVGGGGSYLWVISSCSNVLIDDNNLFYPNLPVEVEGSFYYDMTVDISKSGHLLTNNDVFTSHSYHYGE